MEGHSWPPLSDAAGSAAVRCLHAWLARAGMWYFASRMQHRDWYHPDMICPPMIRRSVRVSAFVAATLCTVFGSLPARAIIINGEGPPGVTGIYDRFIAGTYATAPVVNPTFIGSSFDLSGIGWLSTAPSLSITLVSSQYFVLASHFNPGIGVSMRFFGTDGLLHSATVDTYHVLTYTGSGGAAASDLTLGRFTTALPSTVTPMPIFYPGATSVSTPSSFAQYDGVSLFNYGHMARMGTNNLDGFSEYSFTPGGSATNIGVIYTQGAGAGETLLESGDSGSPTLGFKDGVYGLIGTHSGVDTPGLLSVDAFVSYTEYVNQMNAFLAADGQALTLVGVPEPGTIFMGIALLGVCGARRIRRTGSQR